jgi:hypothetical protein
MPKRISGQPTAPTLPKADAEAIAKKATATVKTPAKPTTPFGTDQFAGVKTTGVVASPATGKAVELKSPLLRGDATLSSIAGGGAEMSKGAKGDSVKRFQQALQEAGYPLPKFGADGDFGNETKSALASFQKASGLEPTGTLDAATLGKLDAAAASKVRYPEYDKMFKDGVLNTTIGIGYDEDGNDIEQRKEIVEGLATRGFEPLDVANKSDDELKKLGIDPKMVDREATYYTKKFDNDGKDVVALVKLVDRNSTNPKKQFGDGMENSELVIYSGHARYGSGPDFDDIKSSKGNYVIGQPYEQGHVTIGANDLKKAKMTDGYQMMMFDGCTTRNYLDDLRSIPKNKSAANLDIIASNKELPWNTGTADVFTTLDGVMAKKSVDDMKSDLEKRNDAGFTADGFKANTYRPPQ